VTFRRLSLLIVLVLVAAACGGGVTGVPAPTPTATPAPGGIGTVTGSVAVSASAAPASSAVPARPVRSTIGAPVYVPDKLFVKLRAGVATAASAELHRQVRATLLKTLPRIDVQVVRLASGTTPESAMAAYRASGLVEYVERVGYAHRMIVPNDPSFGAQWHYGIIGLPAAWDNIRGAGVIVAVIDSGMRSDHPDLAGVAVFGPGNMDFIDDPANGDGNGPDPDPTDPGCPADTSDPSHGTHVAGTIAALSNNGVGVAGVNWGGATPIRIMPLRVLGLVPPYTAAQCGFGSYADIIEAIDYAVLHGAKIINMSLGGSAGSTPMDTAIANARAAGVTLVAAAGNNSCGAISYPARNPNVIAVGATTSTDTRASYSNCGPELDVTAPGGSGGAGVLSTTWSPAMGFQYLAFQGTSMASPHVAGVAALMYGRGITDPTTIQSTLQSTALDLGSAGFDNEFGWGRIRADMAVSGGSSAARQCAFSGILSGGTITRQSDMREVTGSGAFTVTTAQSGVKSVFVWQDVDGNGSVNTGDIYGETTGVAIFNAQTTSGVTVTVQTRTSGMPTLLVPGGTGSCAP
jgi:serine protease